MNREAALFVFYKVSSECPPAAAEHTLKAVFKAIRAQPALLMTRAAPRLTATTCRVIGNYARDVLRNPANASALEFAIRYFLYVLEHSKGLLALSAFPRSSHAEMPRNNGEVSSSWFVALVVLPLRFGRLCGASRRSPCPGEDMPSM